MPEFDAHPISAKHTANTARILPKVLLFTPGLSPQTSLPSRLCGWATTRHRKDCALSAARTLAERGEKRRVTAMSTVQEIKAAIEKLSTQELREVVAWFDERQASLNASDALFQAYDREEQGT
jgi:hypothetical protein